MNQVSNRVFRSFGIFAAIAILYTAPAFAQDSEIGVVFPWKAIEKDFAFLNNGASQTWKDQINAMDLPIDSLVVQIPKVAVTATLAKSQLAVQKGVFNVAINQIKIQLDVAGLTIDQLIEKNVGGVIVKVRVQANCGAFSLVQAQAQSNALLNLEVQGNTSIVPKFQSFKVNWPKNSWKVSTIQCAGPQGMGDLIQQQLSQKLADPEDFRPGLEQILLKQMQSAISAPLAKWSKSQLVSQGAEALVVRLKKIESIDKGFLFISTVADPVQPGTNEVPLEVSNIKWNAVPDDVPTMLMPTLGIERILQKRWLRVPEWISYNLNQIPAFQALVRSRFQQFFAWPDLMNYPKSAQFNLMIQKPQDIPLTWDSKGQAQSSVDTIAWMQSWRDNQGWNYIGIKASADINWALDIQNGQLQILGNPNFKSLSTFVNEEYQKAYGEIYYSESTMQDAIKKALSTINVGLQLPNLQMTATTAYQAHGWKALDRNTILVPWITIKTNGSN